MWRALQLGGEEHRADAILIDLGPNFGALNRTTLISADHVAMPLGPDLFSLQGLKNLGPALREWRDSWQERRPKCEDSSLELPAGTMNPLGYIVMQHSLRLDRPAAAYEKWIGRMPSGYSESVLGEASEAEDAESDPHCLARLKHFRSHLADGARCTQANLPVEVGGRRHRLPEHRSSQGPRVVRRANVQVAARC